MKFRLIYLGLIAMILLNSCGYNRQKYLLNLIQNNQDTIISEVKRTEYRIQSNDILSIRVASYNKEAVSVFETAQVNSTMNANIDAYTFLGGYNVNDSGLIIMPVLGKISVLSKTLSEIQTLIQGKIDEYVKDAYVTVKLMNFKITVMGEVGSPGTKMIISNRINILEAISLAGDIKEIGEKRNVMIVRQTLQGYKTFRIDLTNKDLLKLSSFELQPNDIVYVEPRKVRGFQMDVANITLTAALLSALILIFNFIKINR